MRRNVRTLSRRPDVHATSYGTALGYRPLREQLRVKLTDFGIATTPDQIILTHGATQALDIVTRTLIQPGDCVFCRRPRYWNLFANLRLCGANLVGVPRGDDGPDPEALEALLRGAQTEGLLHAFGAAQSDLGNLSPATAFRVLQLAEKHDFLIVEDDAYGDFHPGRRHASPSSTSSTGSSMSAASPRRCQPTCVSASSPATPICAHASLTSRSFPASRPRNSPNAWYLMLTEGHYRKLIERLQAGWPTPLHVRCACWSAPGWRRTGSRKGNVRLGGSARHRRCRAPGQRRCSTGHHARTGRNFPPAAAASPFLRFNAAYALDKRLERYLG